MAEERLVRAALRRHVDVPDSRPRPHRLSARARREPARVAGQPARGGRRARPPRRDSRARRQGGRGRSAPHRHRRSAPTSGCRSARHRRGAAARDGTGAVRGGPRAPGPARRVTNGIDEVGELCREFTPEAVAEHVRRPGRDDPRDRARPLRRAARGRLRPHRHLQPGVRDARVVARRRDQRADGQPRPRRRRDVLEPDRVVARESHAARVRERLRVRALEQPRARRARGAGPGADLVPGRGDRHAGAGPDPGADHDRRKPGALRARRREARRRAARRSSA